MNASTPRPFRDRRLLESRPSPQHPDGTVVLYRLRGGEFATWVERDGARYWGHYFTDLTAATADWETR